jgi:hypothetical protein
MKQACILEDFLFHKGSQSLERSSQLKDKGWYQTIPIISGHVSLEEEEACGKILVSLELIRKGPS